MKKVPSLKVTVLKFLIVYTMMVIQKSCFQRPKANHLTFSMTRQLQELLFGLKSVWKYILVKNHKETSRLSCNAGQLTGFLRVFAEISFRAEFQEFLSVRTCVIDNQSTDQQCGSNECFYTIWVFVGNNFCRSTVQLSLQEVKKFTIFTRIFCFV